MHVLSNIADFIVAWRMYALRQVPSSYVIFDDINFSVVSFVTVVCKRVAYEQFGKGGGAPAPSKIQVS